MFLPKSSTVQWTLNGSLKLIESTRMRKNVHTGGAWIVYTNSFFCAMGGMPLNVLYFIRAFHI